MEPVDGPRAERLASTFIMLVGVLLGGGLLVGEFGQSERWTELAVVAVGLLSVVAAFTAVGIVVYNAWVADGLPGAGPPDT